MTLVKQQDTRGREMLIERVNFGAGIAAADISSLTGDVVVVNSTVMFGTNPQRPGFGGYFQGSNPTPPLTPLLTYRPRSTGQVEIVFWPNVEAMGL